MSEPNNITLCFYPLFSIEMIKERIKKKKEKREIVDSIKVYTPLEFVEVNLDKLKLNFTF